MKTNPDSYAVRIWYSAEAGDECFVAQVQDMPGIMAHGETREEAAREIEAALTGALAIYAEDDVAPPPPKNASAVALGAQGGSASSRAKKRAAKRNGARGGRPRRTVAA